MKTRVVKAFGDPEKDREVMQEAAGIIKNGGLVAIPTETVYGLAGDALNPGSAGKIYRTKGRPSDNPLIVHIADISAMDRIAHDIPEEAYRLAGRFWPGPLTMVLKKTDAVPYETTGGLDTVAVRYPVNMIAREFIQASGGYIAAPSANLSGKPSCTRASHCLEDLDGKIEMIIDGGEVGIGLESTIVDFTESIPCILRQGYINEEMLRSVLKDLSRDPPQSIHPKAPGMKYRHYAPKGKLSIVKGSPERVTAKINNAAADHGQKGETCAVIAAHENISGYRGLRIMDAGSLRNEDEIAGRLFAILRELDKAGIEYIYSEDFDTPRLGAAIMDRMNRAAGFNVINTDEDQEEKT